MKELEVKSDACAVPDGEYYLERTVKDFGKVKGKAVVEDGLFKVLKGSVCAPVSSGFGPDVRKEAVIENNILKEDIICSSPSSAAWIVIGKSNNGWFEWKDQNGQKIDHYRN